MTKMKSVLIIGQSNMAGRGFIKDVPSIINEHLFMLRNGRFQLMVEPINFDRREAGVGLVSSFAAAWSKDHPGLNLGIIPAAEGGSAISEWQPGEILMEHALAQAKLAQKSSEIIAILWNQGENDSREDLYLSYQEQLKTTFTHLRKELNLPHVPIIMGLLADTLNTFAIGLHCPQFKEINHEMTELTKLIPNTYVVSSEELTMNPDGIHLDAHSLRRWGLRYYESFKKEASVLNKLDNEEAILQAIYDRPLSVNEQIYQLQHDLNAEKITFESYMEQLEALSASQ